MDALLDLHRARIRRGQPGVKAIEEAPRADAETRPFLEAANTLMGSEPISFRDVVLWCEVHGIEEVEDYARFVILFDRTFRKARAQSDHAQSCNRREGSPGGRGPVR